MKALKLLTIFIFYPAVFFAQQPQSKNFLHVGDKMPDVEFSIANYSQKVAKISDFKGKLVILDFFGVYCGSCIAQMPKLEHLQNEFKDKIQIVRVCRDNQDKVDKLMKISEIMQENKLPLVTGEAPLSGMFDIPFFPYYVWIEPNGNIKYITDQVATTADGIRKYFANVDLDIQEKSKVKYDNESPIMPQNNPALSNEFISYSYLAPRPAHSYRPLGIIFHPNTDENAPAHIKCGDCDIFKLYSIAYQRTTTPKYVNVMVDFPGADSLVISHDLPRTGKQLYSYELWLGKNEGEIFTDMKMQLDMFFNLRSSVKRKKIKCYVIKKNGDDHLATKYKPTDIIHEFERDYGLVRFRNTQWAYFANSINIYLPKAPKIILDETGIDPARKVDIDFSSDFSSLKKMQNILKPFGLTIEEKTRMLEMVVLEKGRATSY